MLDCSLRDFAVVGLVDCDCVRVEVGADLAIRYDRNSHDGLEKEDAR